MSEAPGSSSLDQVLAESKEEVRGYLRDSLQQIRLLADKGMEVLDAGELPIGVAERLFDHAKAVMRNTDHLVTYEELAEAVKEQREG